MMANKAGGNAVVEGARIIASANRQSCLRTPTDVNPNLELSPAGTDSPAAARTWGVAALLLATADTLAARFGAVSVQGELGGFARASSGHCYFSLKDSGGAPALLRCAMFRRHAALLAFAPADGMKVQLRGRLAVYEARGELQMVVESLERLGSGSLYEEFLRMRERLAALGLFDAARKRPLPTHPRRIAVVTSPAAAAWRDAMAALARRSPQVEVVLVPSAVQGAEAPLALAEALERAGRLAGVDTVLLVRGGGSIEDLWAFNDERVVRAVASCARPVVCGVGHESDIVLADLAADLRAATPTAAAELAAPAQAELALAAMQRQRRLLVAVQRQWQRHEQRLDRLALQLGQRSQALAPQHERLTALQRRLASALQWRLAAARQALQAREPMPGQALARRLQAERQRSAALAARFAALDPARVLGRGYAWIEGDDGRAVIGVAGVQVGQALRTVWADGQASVEVRAVRPKAAA
jgi:exodeoxyribonuclease VII large subunit